MTENNEICPKCGSTMNIKEGRFGQFFACSGYPDCKTTKPLNDNGNFNKPPAVKPTNEKCEKCGSAMVEKNGRYGPFIACSGYPDCRNIKNIEQSTGVACPKCKQGDIVAKRSRQGRIFYSCNKYPECKFALWQKPTGEKCSDCNSLLTITANNKIRCSNKACKFSQAGEK
ncbi:topoisomerase DNA-binding C4 zinc finger domain-containing protein [Patescibacteria group bacterium]|nr:topoisomerase DNA-binding C4 zinc finger domain-containing protein [Patescibacteria group bacterium]MBU0964444.1 topoisomerase DNA-binding C4 zinc finger domain-containing protein [Patescibacteria group bacterium]